MPRRFEEEILRKHFPLIEGYFQARVTQREDIEDLCQETAYQVIRSWGRFQHRASVSTWIYAISRNVFTSYLRKKNRDNKESSEFLTDRTFSPDENERWTIEIVLKSMKPAYRLLFDLFYRQGCSIREIARHTAKPEGTVKYELYMLRKKAKELVG